MKKSGPAEPPAQPRSPLFGRTSEPKEEQPAPAEEGEAPSRPETSYEFTDARPQSAPADGRRRRRKKKKKRRKSRKKAGFFSLKEWGVARLLPARALHDAGQARGREA